MREHSGKKIFWDYDDTIIDKHESSHAPKIRYGFRQLLRDFSPNAGFTHVITSRARLGHITDGLSRLHLENKFDEVFDRDTVAQREYGKHYRQAAGRVGDSEIRRDMIAIGDSNRDKPVDIGGLVFVELGDHEEPHDALVIREILTNLLDAGDGNFHQGYKMLYEKAKPPDVDSPTPSTRRTLDIGNDISFTMEYRTAEEAEEPENLVPVICNIKAEPHRKPYQIF